MRMRWHKKFKILRCYILILGWLGILLLFLSFWKVETDPAHPPPPLMVNAGVQPASASLLQQDKPRSRKLRHHCNPPDRIQQQQEGVVPAPYELLGVLIAFRHGDRGPLMPVRNMSTINCGHKSYGTPSYKKYVSDILNTSKTNTYINFVGPFMKFPLLPPPSKCNTGHLTPQGVAQHLQLGKVLKAVYIDELNLVGSKQEFDDIVVYSTKYRRTFQSLLAFLYSFLPGFNISKIRIREGKGVGFCENDCRCDKIDYYDGKAGQERRDTRKSHPGVMEMVDRLSPIIKSNPSAEDITNPLVMQDALLAYICHGAALPCSNGKCVKVDEVTSLLSYCDWEGKQKGTSSQRKSAKLKAFGLLKNIMATIDGMIGDERPRVMVYSGHDKTLKYLLESLSIPHYPMPPYAARLIIEVYRNSSNTQGIHLRSNHFFRLVYNGKDITKLIPFCDIITLKQHKLGIVKRVSINICNITNLENYINPQNYFKEFNAASFKAACKK